MPTAQSAPDAELSISTGYVANALRTTLTFQITPRLSGSLRYSVLEDIDVTGFTRYDRSFDIRYRFVDEGRYRPAFAIGLRDFAGTGIYGGEYLAGTKHLNPKLAATAGIGWGRLGSYNGFSNPLGVFSDRFKTRPDSFIFSSRFTFDRWFRGDAAFFGGLEWQPSEHLAFKLEYSSDAYVKEVSRGLIVHRSPFNVGVNYRFDNGVGLAATFLHGSDIGVMLSYSLNPKNPRVPGGVESAPVPVAHRGYFQAASRGRDWVENSGRVVDIRQQVASGLSAQDLELESLSLTGTAATLRLRNDYYDAEAQAVGRAARVLTQTLPASVEVLTIVPVVNGLPLSAVTLKRADLEELESAPDGSWQSYVRAQITEAPATRLADAGVVGGIYPRFDWDLNAYLSPGLFDPDDPVRADLGIQLSAAYFLTPRLIVSGQIRQPVFGNLDKATRLSDSVLPHVRSDTVLYDVQSGLEINHLSAEYFFRPGRNFYGRITAGYLERMYGGLSAEVLWKPVDSRFALGGEVNYVRQRDFDQLFGFRNYSIATGHVSAYYGFGNGFHGQMDVGRYLAGDWGATFTLDREFRNGWRIGAFFTLTDVSASDFGEGSFDKGIRLYIPLSWLSGKPSQKGFDTVIRPVTRDGGARLDVRNRLYDLTRGYHDSSLNDRWGRFWR